jgi:hypothetical protein
LAVVVDRFLVDALSPAVPARRDQPFTGRRNLRTFWADAASANGR